MKVLVAGATGRTGKLIVERLAEEDHYVAALIRNKDKAGEMERSGSKPIVADLEFDVSFAVEGMDAVVFVAGSGLAKEPEKARIVDQEGAIKLIDACEKNGVERFIMLSSISAKNPDEGPKELKPYLEAKRNADDRLIKSRLNYTIFRAGALNDEEEKGGVAIGKDSKGEISRMDIARIIVEALDSPMTYRRIIEVVGGIQSIDEALKTI